MSRERVGRRVRYEGLEHLRDAYASGRGVLLFTGHFGHWELAASDAGLPRPAAGRSSPGRWTIRASSGCSPALRGGSGNRIIHKRNAVREILKALRERPGRGHRHRPGRAARRRLRPVLRTAGLDDADPGAARAAHGRRGHPLFLQCRSRTGPIASSTSPSVERSDSGDRDADVLRAHRRVHRDHRALGARASRAVAVDAPALEDPAAGDAEAVAATAGGHAGSQPVAVSAHPVTSGVRPCRSAGPLDGLQPEKQNEFGRNRHKLRTTVTDAAGEVTPRRVRHDAEELVRIVRRFEGRRVVVLGDLVADEFVYGDIARISREAPVLILRAPRATAVVPGGGGQRASPTCGPSARVPLPVGVRRARRGRPAPAGRAAPAPASATAGILRHPGLRDPAQEPDPRRRRPHAAPADRPARPRGGPAASCPPDA